VILGALILFAAAWQLAAPGGYLDRTAGPLARASGQNRRRSSDVFAAWYGATASPRRARARLAPRPAPGNSGARPRTRFLALFAAFSWGCRSSSPRPPAISSCAPALSIASQGPGRLYVSPALPRSTWARRAPSADALLR